MKLLEEVVDEIIAAGDRTGISKLLYDTVRERGWAMHERAQRAEGRAHKAERLATRMSGRLSELHACGVIEASGMRCGAPVMHAFNPDGGSFHCHVLPTIEFHLDGRVFLSGEPWQGHVANHALAEHLTILAKMSAPEGAKGEA